MKYRSEIDGLRALAVMPVIFFHAGWTGFSGGFIGVDVFFVISGYLITSIILPDLEAGNFSFLSFYERRARRILPALFLVMFVSMPFAWLWLLPADLQDFLESVVAATLFSSNILFWRESGYFETSEALKPLIHTWSLGVEEQFYLLYPVFLILLWKYARKYFVQSMAAGLIVSLVFSEYMSRHYPSANFFLLQSRGWELLAGASLAYIENKRPLKYAEKTSSIFTAVGVLMILAAVMFFDKDTRHPGLITIVPVAGTMLVIAFGRSKGFTNKLLSHRCFVGIGLISYSLYLWHQPVFAFARAYSLQTLTPATYANLILLSFMLALLSYKYVEAPFRNKQSFNIKYISVLAGFLSIGFVSFGIAGVVTSGFPGRMPDDLSAKIEGDKYKKIYVKTTDEWEHCYAKNKQSPCLIGKKSLHISWALVGDSHAGALAGRLDVSLKKSGKTGVFLANKGCVYALGLRRADKLEDECLKHNFYVRTRLLKSDIENIVISGRYVLNLEKYKFDNGEGGVESGKPVLFEPVAYADEQERRKLVMESFSSSVEELLKQGKSVYLVYPVPEVGWDVPRQAFKQKFKGISEPISTNSALYYERSAAVISVFNSISSNGNLVRIYPDRVFCNTIIPDRCVTEINNKILYADDDHLSDDGAKIVVKEIMEAVNNNI